MALAAAKLGEARTLEEALDYLGPDEQPVALATPALFELLDAEPSQPERDPPGGVVRGRHLAAPAQRERSVIRRSRRAAA